MAAKFMTILFIALVLLSAIVRGAGIRAIDDSLSCHNTPCEADSELPVCCNQSHGESFGICCQFGCADSGNGCAGKSS